MNQAAAEKCPFCSPEKSAILFSNQVRYAWWDAFPATRGDLLVIPFRQVTAYFERSPEEKGTLPEILEEGKTFLD